MAIKKYDHLIKPLSIGRNGLGVQEHSRSDRGMRAGKSA